MSLWALVWMPGVLASVTLARAARPPHGGVAATGRPISPCLWGRVAEKRRRAHWILGNRGSPKAGWRAPEVCLRLVAGAEDRLCAAGSGDDGGRDAAAGRLNEAMFRDANEATAKGRWPGDERPVRFRCECARADCGTAILLRVGEYQRVRRDPRWFVVAAGHERPAVEAVVERQPGYLVVEKRGAAGAVAEELDPRA